MTIEISAQEKRRTFATSYAVFSSYESFPPPPPKKKPSKSSRTRGRSRETARDVASVGSSSAETGVAVRFTRSLSPRPSPPAAKRQPPNDEKGRSRSLGPGFGSTAGPRRGSEGRARAVDNIVSNLVQTCRIVKRGCAEFLEGVNLGIKLAASHPGGRDASSPYDASSIGSSDFECRAMSMRSLSSHSSRRSSSPNYKKHSPFEKKGRARSPWTEKRRKVKRDVSKVCRQSFRSAKDGCADFIDGFSVGVNLGADAYDDDYDHGRHVDKYLMP